MRLRGKASRAGKWKLLQKHEAIFVESRGCGPWDMNDPDEVDHIYTGCMWN